MSITIKKIVSSLILVAALLSPLSIHLNSSSPAKIEIPSISVSSNSAYALTVPCDDPWWSILDNTACGVGNFFLTYFELVWFYLTQILVVIVGLMLDMFLFFSLSGDFYRSGLIEAGWEIIRDFTNILFIFALLVSAFKLVLGLDQNGAKKIVLRTILIALVTNFSLFVTYAVIDTSNILAYTFYNKIEAGESQKFELSEGQTNGNGEENESGLEVVDLGRDLLGSLGGDSRSVSLAIIGNINPQKIITRGGVESFGQAYVSIAMSGLMNILLIYVFGSIMFLFVGRTLGLVISSIIGPLAFVSILIPGFENNKYIGLGNWVKQLLSLAFMAPVFLFFLYVVVTFLNDDGLLGSLSAKSDTFFGTIINVYMFFFIIAGLLLIAKKVAKDMAGELGGIASKAVRGATGAVGAAAGVAVTAGAAATGIGLRAIGQVAKASGNKKAHKELSKAGKRAMSWKADVTKIPGFKAVVGKQATGMISSVTGKSALGHIDAAQKKGKGAFGNEYNKLKADKENKELKKANDDANDSRGKAEGKHEAGLYQKRMDAEKARKKRDDVKEGFVDNKGNTGGYREAKVVSEKERKNQKELNKTLQQLQRELNGLPAGFASQNERNEKNQQIQEVEQKIAISKNHQQSADTFIQNISVDYNQKQSAVEEKRADQKADGDAAERESRIASAAKASTGALADKIMKGAKAKGKSISIDDMKKIIEKSDKGEI